MNNSSLIRPAWTPVTIAMMVIGFIIYWPLGLAMIAYILWGDRLDVFMKDLSGSTDRFTATVRETTRAKPSGNMAFDEWRKSELQELAEKRRKLDQMMQEFDEYQDELRRAKDKEAFDEFMNSRKQSKS